MRYVPPLSSALAVAALAALATAPARAQDDLTCPDTTGIQPILNECAARDYRRADDALNAAWTEAHEQATQRDAERGTGGEDGEAAHLLAAQRGWLAYRDGQCAVRTYGERGGSIQPMLEYGCLTGMTVTRTGELRGIARDPMDPGTPPMQDGEDVTCSFDDGSAERCTMTVTDVLGTGDGGPDQEIVWTASDRAVLFVGRRMGPWWSGELDGAPAMGRELNRGNVVFSTRDLERSFQYWADGMEHGSY